MYLRNLRYFSLRPHPYVMTPTWSVMLSWLLVPQLTGGARKLKV